MGSSLSRNENSAGGVAASNRLSGQKRRADVLEEETTTNNSNNNNSVNYDGDAEGSDTVVMDDGNALASRRRSKRQRTGTGADDDTNDDNNNNNENHHQDGTGLTSFLLSSVQSTNSFVMNSIEVFHRYGSRWTGKQQAKVFLTLAEFECKLTIQLNGNCVPDTPITDAEKKSVYNVIACLKVFQGHDRELLRQGWRILAYYMVHRASSSLSSSSSSPLMLDTHLPTREHEVERDFSFILAAILNSPRSLLPLHALAFHAISTIVDDNEDRWKAFFKVGGMPGLVAMMIAHPDNRAIQGLCAKYLFRILLVEDEAQGDAMTEGVLLSLAESMRRNSSTIYTFDAVNEIRYDPMSFEAWYLSNSAAIVAKDSFEKGDILMAEKAMTLIGRNVGNLSSTVVINDFIDFALDMLHLQSQRDMNLVIFEGALHIMDLASMTEGLEMVGRAHRAISLMVPLIKKMPSSSRSPFNIRRSAIYIWRKFLLPHPDSDSIYKGLASAGAIDLITYWLATQNECFENVLTKCFAHDILMYPFDHPTALPFTEDAVRAFGGSRQVVSMMTGIDHDDD